MARTVLDRWARALGADNDADAIDVLESRLKLVNALVMVGVLVSRGLRDCPDDDAAVAAAEAVVDLVQIEHAMQDVQRKFVRHLRGEGL